jgi:electron transport complex protein RnfB
MADNPQNRRVIDVDGPVVDPRGPRLRSVRPRKLSDYADVPAAYLEIARSYSNPLLVGPPICDELIALVQHMFTAEEASLARHIKSPTGKTARAVAAAAQRPVDEVRPVLERLAYDKFILFAFGSGDRKRYGLMPIVPGVFEMTLMRTSLDTLTDWHRRFAELFSALYDTGYLVDYVEHPLSSVRYVPVGEAIESHPMALPSDRLEEVLDRYSVFGVGLCQCRMAEQIVGRGCDRPLENCIGFGAAAEFLIHQGKMRAVDKAEVLEIKAQASAAGLVSFVIEIEAGQRLTGASCSCCGCCCGALRTITQHNAPGMIAPPHFMPRLDAARCTYCAQCARACPTGAWVLEAENRLLRHLPERCIGCGLCAVACDRQQAIRMDPNPAYRPPATGVVSTLLQSAPNYLRNAWSVWRKYR